MPTLAGWLGEGGTYEGELETTDRERIDGTFIGALRCDDLVEVGPHGVVRGSVDTAQALVYGHVSGTLTARERVTLMESAVIEGRLCTPWLDVRPGARLTAEVEVQREPS